jgi:cytochrome c oxidase assembly protein subunit 15
VRRVSLSPAAYRRITAGALVALGVIIVSGGAVRLTGSGLGCSDWPTCENDRLVAPFEYHAMVEFVNRTFTGLVSIAVILAVLGSLVRVPRRRDLTWWSLGLVAGVGGQVVLGGITVLFELAPPLVMAHFLLSMVLVWNAVVLHHKAAAPDGHVVERAVPELRTLSWLLVTATALVVATGTIVTGSGPHGGDADVRRLGFFVPDVARIHGTAVFLLVALLLACLRVIHRGGAGPEVERKARVLLGVVAAQAAVGYTQYFTGVPVVLVGVHILGAVLVWISVLRVHLSLRAVEAPTPVAASALVTA